jgi:type IV pilus assembly protein PilQ
MTLRIRTLALAICVTLVPVPAPAAAHTISLNVRDADIYDVVQLLATQSQRNIVLDMPTVQHDRVTMRLDNITFEAALQTLAQSDGLVIYTAPDGTIYLGRGAAFIARVGMDGGSITPHTYALRNGNAEILRNLLAQQFTNVLFVADPRSNTLVVWAPPEIAQGIAAVVASLDTDTFGGAGMKAATIHLRYHQASDAEKMLTAGLSIQRPNSVTAVDATNSLVVVGTPDFVGAAQHLIASIDKPGEEVRFDVRVADVTPQNDNSDIGVAWGGVDQNGTVTPASGQTVTTFANRTLAINAQLNLLVSKGKASILAQPSISTLNNVTGTLNVGEQIPIVYFNPQTGIQNVTFVQAGVDLKITPVIAPDGVSTVHLEADYSQVISYNQGYPVIGQRKVDWHGLVAPDQSIVLSGLFEDISSETVQKIPLLGDIPILGTFFRNKTQSHLKDEIVFIITPHIVPKPATLSEK